MVKVVYLLVGLIPAALCDFFFLIFGLFQELRPSSLVRISMILLLIPTIIYLTGLARLLCLKFTSKAYSHDCVRHSRSTSRATIHVKRRS